MWVQLKLEKRFPALPLIARRTLGADRRVNAPHFTSSKPMLAPIFLDHRIMLCQRSFLPPVLMSLPACRLCQSLLPAAKPAEQKNQLLPQLIFLSIWL